MRLVFAAILLLVASMGVGRAQPVDLLLVLTVLRDGQRGAEWHRGIWMPAARRPQGTLLSCVNAEEFLL